MKNNSRKIIYEIIERYACDSISDSAEEQTQKWLIGDSYPEEKEEALWNLWNGIEPEPIENAEECLCEIKKSLGIPVERTAAPNIPRSFRFLSSKNLLRFAAVLVPFIVIIGISHFVYTKKQNIAEQQVTARQRINYLTSDDLHQQLILEDGTEVWLNKHSVLSYTNDRKATLVGESYFKVKKNDGEKFVVSTEFLSATVVGTSFNIQANPDSDVVVISLYEGILDIKNDDISLRLEAGTELVYNKISSEVKVNNISSTKPDWTRDIIDFDKATIKSIFGDLEKIYNVTIECTDVSFMSNLITLQLERSVGLDEVLFFMSKISGKFDYKIIDNKVIINVIKIKDE